MDILLIDCTQLAKYTLVLYMLNHWIRCHILKWGKFLLSLCPATWLPVLENIQQFCQQARVGLKCCSIDWIHTTQCDSCSKRWFMQITHSLHFLKHCLCMWIDSMGTESSHPVSLMNQLSLVPRLRMRKVHNIIVIVSHDLTSGDVDWLRVNRVI